MKESKWFRWLGVIALGVLGSAVWELAVRPLGDVGIKLTLNVVTLGLDSLRDGLYADAARGSIERVSAVTLMIVSSMLFGLLGGTLGARRAKRRHIAMISELDSLTHEELNLKKQEIQIKIERLEKQRRYVFVIAGVTVITIYFMAQRAIYVNGLTSYFERMYAVSAPYLSENERLKVRSEFFLIKNRSEYVKLLDKLKSTAQVNNIEPPTFVAF